jgi:hypothetical protein
VDANVALIVALSLPSFDFVATLEALDASLSATIGKAQLHDNHTCLVLSSALSV